MDLTGIGTAVAAVSSFVGKFFPDKTQQERDAAALELQQLIADSNIAAAQLAVDQAEATSPDRVNHWRGAIGWVCAFGLAWHYVGLPVLQYGAAVAVVAGWSSRLPAPPDLNASELNTILFAMLGMIGSHAVPKITGIFGK